MTTPKDSKPYKRKFDPSQEYEVLMLDQEAIELLEKWPEAGVYDEAIDYALAKHIYELYVSQKELKKV